MGVVISVEVPCMRGARKEHMSIERYMQKYYDVQCIEEPNASGNCCNMVQQVLQIS